MRHGDKKNITLWFEPEWVERMDKLAEKAGVTRTRMLENVVRMNVEELEMLDKVGVFTFAKILNEFREAIRGGVSHLETA